MIARTEPPVWLSPLASQKTKQMWSLHGGPHSSRYTDPRLTSLSALLRYNAENIGSDTAFLYPDQNEDSQKYLSVTWKAFDMWTTVLAKIYSERLQEILAEGNATCTQPTVALLGGGHTLEYFATQMALQKLNLRVLLIAPKTPQSAMDHLMSKTNVKAILVDSLNNSLHANIPMISMEEKPFLIYDDDDQQLPLTFEDGKDPWERHTFIIHSSGSTGLPKPITHTNRSMMMIAKMYRLFPEFHIENWYLLFPLFHIAGISIILSGLPNGMVTSLPPRFWPPQSSSILQSWKILSHLGHPVECLHCAPMLIENLVDYIEQTSNDFKPLSDLKILQPGGAMLADSVVTKLVAHNVNVKTTYGSTEIGAPLRSIPHSRDNTECYKFANLFPENDKLEMQDLGDGLYECVIYNGFEFAAELWENKDDTTPYRTNDLFVQSPPNSGYYILEGRKDDILVHTTGENTNANAFETTLKGYCKDIKRLVMLGHGRVSPCLLIEPSSHDDGLKGNIMDVIERVNQLYPKHSTVAPSLVYFLTASQSLPVTPKGNVKRKEAEKSFLPEVESLYKTFQGRDEGIPEHSFVVDMNISDIKLLARKAVADVCRLTYESIGDDTNFYDLGIDSLGALKLRARLSEVIGTISINDIFENPSVTGLLRVFKNKHGASELKETTLERHRVFVDKTVENYSSIISSWNRAQPFVHHENASILLTGTSGSLGTALLENLVASPQVAKVFALVHGRGGFQRIRDSMISRNMNFDKLFATGKIEVLEYNMKDFHLGLGEKNYHRLLSEVTAVIHGAWVMDFNKPVEEFEEDCIKGLLNLLQFCCTVRTKIFGFVSSVATNMGTLSHGAIQESVVGRDSGLALSTGYGQSKYIAERLCQVASENLDLPVRILRLGQMYGNTRTGAWSMQEMFPIMIATSTHLRALPNLSGQNSVDWIPVDIAASTMFEIMMRALSPGNAIGTSTTRLLTHNIVNPYPITWSEFLSQLNDALALALGSTRSLEIISMTEWVSRLSRFANQNDEDSATQGAPRVIPAAAASSDDHISVLPGLKLLGFFEEMAKAEPTNEEIKCSKGDPGVSIGMSKDDTVDGSWKPRYFETSMTRSISPALTSCTPVNKDVLSLCALWWKSQSYLGSLLDEVA